MALTRHVRSVIEQKMSEMLRLKQQRELQNFSAQKNLIESQLMTTDLSLPT
ncbi:15555_t:CDS:2, partial [Funneliformis mosseae]